MDTKFSPDYWSHRQVEDASPEIKLAGAWMRTNSSLTLFGYAEVTPRRFAFETGLAPETLARACEALSEWFQALPKGYFAPNHIREQIGSGDSLLNNNVCKGLVRALVTLNDEQVTTLVLRYYPELEDALKVIGSAKGLPTPCQGVRAEKSREEQRGAEPEGGAGETTPAPKKRAKKAGAAALDAMPEPTRARMLRLNEIFRRQSGTRWSADELTELKASGLLELAAEEFAEQVQLVVDYHRADIPREMERQFWRRTVLVRVLRHWSETLDLARAWKRRSGGAESGGLRRFGEDTGS